MLQTLVRDGLLTQQNQRRWASYRVAEDSPQSGDDSPHLAVDSPQSSPQLQLNSPQLERLAGLPAEIQGLLPVAEPRESEWLEFITCCGSWQKQV